MLKPALKPGDSVTISLPALKTLERTCNNSFYHHESNGHIATEMYQYDTKSAIVITVYNEKNDYYLDLDKGKFYWRREWLQHTNHISFYGALKELLMNNNE